MKVEFLSTGVLPAANKIKEVIVLAFYGKEVVALTKGGGKLRLPRFRLEQGESIDKTLLRELYTQTGAITGKCSLVGVISKADRETEFLPVYAANIVEVENSSLSPDGMKRVICSVESLSANAKEFYSTAIRDEVLYQAYLLRNALRTN